MVKQKLKANFNVAVLFITYARPEYARQSFDAIKAARPAKLYFYSNKARSGHFDELQRNNEIRSFIDEIDWNCDLKTFFREDYVEIYSSLFSAIDWVFKNEEQAIILEEDCVASVAFFDYCEKLLNYYKNERKVWMISGNNVTPKGNPSDVDYLFSRYGHIYGWASWSDRWFGQDRELKTFHQLKNSEHFLEYFGDKRIASFFLEKFEKLFNKITSFNPWDFINAYNMIKNDALAIIPIQNLVSNIGICGHHNRGKRLNYKYLPIPSNEVYLINKYLDKIEPTSYDKYHFKHHFWKNRPTFFNKVKNRIYKILKLS